MEKIYAKQKHSTLITIIYVNINMFAKIISIFTSMFTRNKIGMLIEILLLRAGSTVAKEILDKDN